MVFKIDFYGKSMIDESGKIIMVLFFFVINNLTLLLEIDKFGNLILVLKIDEYGRLYIDKNGYIVMVLVFYI